jgi:polysaccharide export outer membrane protein
MNRRDFLAQAAWPVLGSALLGACAALPRSGPLSVEMRSADGPDEVEGLLVNLTPEVLARIQDPPQPAFPPNFLAAASIDPTRIGVGDFLDITIWENEGGGLFTMSGGSTVIPRAEVDPDGRVFVPFAGRLRASGSTLAELRTRIQQALEPLTLRPQVDVRMTDARSRFVTVQGAVASPGLYPIERQTARLGGMLAQAGGATGEPVSVEAVVRRGNVIGRQLLADILRDPRLDIALRPGDQIVLSPIRERFIALGASSSQLEATFPTRPLDLLAAIGAARGLRDFDADPTGIFVLRYEIPAVADALLPGPQPPGVPPGPGRPIVYRLDLTGPEGVFIARRFQMRDGDTMLISNAPLTELRKILQLFNTVVTPVNTIDALPAP